MTEDHKDSILAECLEAYHRQRARGERPDLETFRERLGDLHGEFIELVAAETAIDEALDPSADMPLPQAWGKYTILREIARGGAGVVYEAVHRELGRTVALKILRTGFDTDKTTRERFRREAQALAQVEHDHIVPLYEFGEVDGRPYYAMSLVNGPTLAQLVKRGEQPEPREICAGLAGIANALETLHREGIVHRDVKPSNIMIGPNGRYMLADFGLARSAAALGLTQTGDAIGTPLYMSPEQMLGKKDEIDARSDVYGLGATLYQCLTGQPPFKTDNMSALMRMVLQQRPESARAVNPDLPEGCSRIAMKCLEKEARDRYPTAGDLEADLRAFAEGERVAGRPLSLWQRSVRRVVNHPVYAAAAMILLAFGAWLAIKPPPPPPPPLLSVQSELAGTLQFEGSENRLSVPLASHRLPKPGAYRFDVVPDDRAYKAKEVAIDIRAGTHKEVVLDSFEPVDVNNPASYAEQMEAAKIGAGEAMEEPKTHRGAGWYAPAIELRFPRGKVRMQDLEHWYAHGGISAEFPDEGGVLEFRAGEELLGTESFPLPQQPHTHGPLPEDVLAKLKPGMTVSWRFVTHAGKPLGAPAVFEIVERDLDKRFARVGDGMRDWSEETRTHFEDALKAEILLQEELYTGAYRQVQPYVAAGTASQHMVVIQMKALKALQDATVARAAQVSKSEERRVRKELGDWTLWDEVNRAYGRWSKEQWQAYFAAMQKD